ncbi:MAG: hypothetical protein LBB65_06145, partial [Burkholderiales bacterium]|nr:hypothetical protein [Burkholderiales bacterium]
MEGIIPEIQKRSTFVTVLAWIFIVLSGFYTLISIFQNIMIQTVFRSAGFFDPASRSPPTPGTPAFFKFMFDHIHWLFLFFLLLFAFMLICSIGLLKRRNWARLCFIGYLALGIVWNLAGLVIQFFMFSSMREEFAADSVQGVPDEMTLFFIFFFVMMVIFAIGFSVLFGW